jgi:hypothetical protein
MGLNRIIGPLGTEGLLFGHLGQKAAPQGLKPIVLGSFMYGLNRLRKNSGFGVKSAESIPQGLKPNVFSIIYGTTKVVP